jgi:BMFP domain-containing protein YqiC
VKIDIEIRADGFRDDARRYAQALRDARHEITRLEARVAELEHPSAALTPAEAEAVRE